jgi:hypothetical protein
MPRKFGARYTDSLEQGACRKKNPKTSWFSGHTTGKRTQSGEFHFTFFHPDYTVGSGVSPDRAHAQRSWALPPVGNYLANLVCPFTPPRRLDQKINSNYNDDDLKNQPMTDENQASKNSENSNSPTSREYSDIISPIDNELFLCDTLSAWRDSHHHIAIPPIRR